MANTCFDIAKKLLVPDNDLYQPAKQTDYQTLTNMLRSFHLDMTIDFEEVPSPAYLDRILSRICMYYAESSYWKQQDNEAIIQEFDGQQGFLYHIDIVLTTTKTIPLHIDRGDLHILYVLSSSGAVAFLNADAVQLCSVTAERARYLYLPAAAYNLVISAGHTQLFGLYFRGTLFRQDNERPYAFLHPLIEAHRNQSPSALASIDFRVGPRTRRQIEMICENIQAQQLHNEGFIYAKLIQLIELSLEKVHEEQSNVQYQQRIAINARNLLTLYIEDEGQCASLKKLETDLNLDSDTINRYHRLYFGISLRSLHSEILLDKAKNCLRAGMTATQTAYTLNYSSLEAFSRFFKKHSGASAKAITNKEQTDNI